MLLFFALFYFVSHIVNAKQAHNATVQVVRYNIAELSNDPKQSYYIELLRLALQKSVKEYGEYELKALILNDVPQGRTLDLLANQDIIDVHWSVTSIAREQLLGVVYIPLLRGLMGARLFLIHKDDAEKFAQINNPRWLFNHSVGSGVDWPDTKIYEKTGFTVATADSTHLHEMLAQKRFELFPRALHEPWGEIAQHSNLMVEPTLALCYPAAMYFFVHPDNHTLRKRLTFGLQQAIEDGSFEALFFSDSIIADAIQRSNFAQRRVLSIPNPFMSIRTRDTLKVEQYVWPPLQNCVMPKM
ncbi:hypothetical protein BET10_14405 [Pseudoalteromonas amylolytica]|uniref:Solute-binding protein family 3/N-terminal domain-containing protein n=1 Tax=Pseudoalteromonas amylolytica TaxID=1859457 RepID=A0A1S1MXP6_9GAMM|nr:hypothetical protein BFC16_20570 [Pseudoalteromonas sp. JW3]OHU90167.1 hypothetical protein BET10_14405 [Pseudoalteromonas amylolytica]